MLLSSSEQIDIRILSSWETDVLSSARVTNATTPFFSYISHCTTTMITPITILIFFCISHRTTSIVTNANPETAALSLLYISIHNKRGDRCTSRGICTFFPLHNRCHHLWYGWNLGWSLKGDMYHYDWPHLSVPGGGQRHISEYCRYKHQVHR